MKKVLLSIFIIVIFFNSFAQPIINRSGAGNTVQDQNLFVANSFRVPVFADTSAANLVTSLDSCGKIIHTRDVAANWVRSCIGYSSRVWIMQLPQGGGTPQSGQAWINPGNTNLFTDAKLNGGFGTLARNGIYIRTNSINRLYLDKDGIAAETGTSVGLGVDLSDSNRITYFTGAAGWGLTGNSGTVAGTNFLGTTDAVGLMFKVNNVQSGYIDNGTKQNTSLGLNSMINNSTGTSNSAFGDYALNSNTTGAGNTGVGQAALLNSVNSNENTAIGLSAMQSNTSGGSNTGVGTESLFSDTSGTENTAIGHSSLYALTNGSKNIAIGNLAGTHLTTESNRLIIASLNHSDKAGDTTKSIIYGAQDANPLNQRLYLNSQVYAPYLKPDVTSNDELLGRVSNNGHISYVNLGSGLSMSNDTLYSTGSGGTVTGSGTTNYLPKWSSSTALGNSVMYDDGTNIGIGTTSPTASKLTVVRDISGAEGGTVEAGDFSMTNEAGDTVAYLFPLHARATITGGTVSNEIAGMSSIIMQSGGTSAGNEAYGNVMTLSGGTTAEIRGYNSTIQSSATVSGAIVGGRSNITQSAGTVGTNISSYRSEITQSGGTAVSNLGYFNEQNIAGSNTLVKGVENTVNITAGTNTTTVGNDNILNLSGGTNTNVIGGRVDLNLTGGTIGSATGLDVKGPNAISTDPTVAIFRSRMATSLGVYITAHASQSQDLFNIVTSGASNLFKVSAAGLVNALAITQSGRYINSVNGAVSAPAMNSTGTWYTGGSSTTTKPYLLIETTGATSNNWQTTGTGIGINAASGFTGSLIDAQTNGSSAFRVTSAGAGIFSSSVTASNAGLIISNTGGNGLRVTNGGFLIFQSDGVAKLSDNSDASWGRLQLGGTTSSFPAIKRSTTDIHFVLANDGGYTATQSLYDRYGSGTPEGAVTAPIGAVFHRTDGGAGTSFYVKESGTGNTGWIAK